MDPNASTRTAPTESTGTVLDGNPVADRIHDGLGSRPTPAGRRRHAHGGARVDD